MNRLNFSSAGWPSVHFIVAGLQLLAGCATAPFAAAPIEQAPFVERAIVETQQSVRVAAAVPDADETRDLIGLDLYARGIQPVWLQVTSLGDSRVRAAIHSIDEEYFSPMEVAWMFRRQFSRQGRADMERWFYDNQLPRWINAGETRSGFVYTRLKPGSKFFNFDVYTSRRSINFTFVVRMPGFVADYMEIEFDSLYDEADVAIVDVEELRAVLASYACCSTNESGETGDPINIVLVGTRLAVGRALIRADWQETAANDPGTAVARTHRHLGRRPDGTFHKSRPDGSERKELRLWRAPILVGDTPVWMGQVSYELQGATGKRGYKDYRIDPDIDTARMYLMQDFWYNQSLMAMGGVGGVPSSTFDAPSQNFAGAKYFTDGKRVVLFLSENPVALDETELLNWDGLSLE